MSNLSTRLGYSLVRVIPRRALTAAAGRLAAAPIPAAARAPIYRAYAGAVGANLAEAGAPLDTYDRFNAFFARPLLPGLRPIAAAHLVSPADGRLAAHGRVDAGRAVQAKGIDYDVAALVGDTELAAALDGGFFATVYLSPADYHRVHAPMGGRVVGVRYIPGELWPVNGLSVPFVDGLFRRNERVVFDCELHDGSPAAVVMVGATVVGAVRVSHPAVVIDATERSPRYVATPDWRVEAGDELGCFLLGSTVVVLLPAGDHAWQAAFGDRLLVGQALLR